MIARHTQRVADSSTLGSNPVRGSLLTVQYNVDQEVRITPQGCGSQPRRLRHGGTWV